MVFKPFWNLTFIFYFVQVGTCKLKTQKVNKRKALYRKKVLKKIENNFSWTAGEGGQRAMVLRRSRRRIAVATGGASYAR